jgi:hypothetical protein
VAKQMPVDTRSACGRAALHLANTVYAKGRRFPFGPVA